MGKATIADGRMLERQGLLYARVVGARQWRDLEMVCDEADLNYQRGQLTCPQVERIAEAAQLRSREIPEVRV